MGTSASSTGPGGGVAFDPPWLDKIENPLPDDQNNIGTDNTDQENDQPQQRLAPPRRFQGARRAMTDYVRTGDKDSLNRAIGHYSRTGMGGASNVSTRMRVSTSSAVSLFGFLQSTRDGNDSTINEWVSDLVSGNASTYEIINQIVSKVALKGGSLDETSCRDSMAQAMGSLLEKEPNINLLELDDNNIWVLIESFLGYEAFKRLCLDIGKAFENPDISPRERVVRMNEMQEYLKAEIFVQTEKLRSIESEIALNQLQTILEKSLRNTFIVYEVVL